MSSSSCHRENKSHSELGDVEASACHNEPKRFDLLLWGSLFLIGFLYAHYYFLGEVSDSPIWFSILSRSVYELMNTIWHGIVIGILMISLLNKIPREFVMSILGTDSGLKGILRATAAGVLLDLCSHGILMVGAKLYERGASIGQVMAFLIASPWNSFSLTIILISLIGISWTLVFILLSMAIAVAVGLLFDTFVKRGVLSPNPQKLNLPEDFQFWVSAKKLASEADFSLVFLLTMLKDGIKGSRMVVRWILFGVLLAGLVRAFVSPEQFGTYFGPTLAGLGLTVLIATLMEVCSEGSTPLAADLLTQAKAPGNSFAFLMTGVSTDYTEIVVMKDVTKSWKIALFLPILTVPQVIIVAWLMNGLAV